MSGVMEAARGPKVSVIVPVYNVERYLPVCVDSLRRQTLKDIEIILVDDGSPDGCPAMCDDYARMDGRIKVVHKENAGLGYARNSGIDVAAGEWLLFVDSDDFLALNALEYLVGVADSAGDGVDQVRFMSNYFPCDSDVAPSMAEIKGDTCMVSRGWERMEPMLASIAPVPVSGSLSCVDALASAWSAIYRREVFVRTGVRFLSEREYISEDYIFNVDFGAVSGGIVYTPERFYFYRVSPGSLTRSLRRDRVERSAFFCESLERRLLDAGYPHASQLAMGTMLGYLRAHNNHIFASDIPLGEKMALFREARKHPFVRRIAGEYEFSGRTLKQRVAFALRGSYFLSWMFTRLNDLLKGRGQRG